MASRRAPTRGALIVSSLALLGLLAPMYFQFDRLLSDIQAILSREPLLRWENVGKKPRILCWILTGAANHMTKAIHVKMTWGSRCDVLLFMSSKEDKELGTIALPGVEEGHGKLWPKTWKAFKYVWEHHADDADWFIKADDDTYMFTDNLLSFLSPCDPSEPHYFGGYWKYNDDHIVNLGGPGYIVSKEALRLFIQESLPYPEKCYTGIRPDYKGDEDSEFSMCLKSVGVFAKDITTDVKGRRRFLGYNPLWDFVRKIPGNYSMWRTVSSYSSDRLISIHYVGADHMYILEYLTNYQKRDCAPPTARLGRP